MSKPALVAITPTAPQLARLIPLPGSDQGWEVLASARAISRVLTGKGLDWSHLSQAVGEIRRLSFEPSGPAPERQPSTLEMAAWCRNHGPGRLSSKDHRFILTVAASLALGKRLSARQSQRLRDIYTRLHHGRVL